MAEKRDTLTRRIAWRPFRWFLGIWLALSLLWLLSGFIGFERERQAVKPPPPNGVPYADFLPGGASRYEDSTYAVAADRLPVYDPTQAGGSYYYVIWPTDEGERLTGQHVSEQGEFGWPQKLISWQILDVYDVSDPGAPFERLPNVRPDPDTSWRYRTLTHHWCPGDLATQKSFTIEKWLLLQWLLALELLSAVVVATIWFCLGRRLRRRLRRGCCLECGYDLRGSETASCSECGAPADDSIESWNTRRGWTDRARPARTFLLLFALLVLLFVVQTFMSKHVAAVKPMAERMVEAQAEVEELAASGIQQSETYHFRKYKHDYGWPLIIFETGELQAWLIQAGRDPVTTRPTYGPGYMGGDVVGCTRLMKDPSLLRHDFLWYVRLVEMLAMLQVIALLLTGIVCWIRSRGVSPRTR